MSIFHIFRITNRLPAAVFYLIMSFRSCFGDVHPFLLINIFQISGILGLSILDFLHVPLTQISPRANGCDTTLKMNPPLCLAGQWGLFSQNVSFMSNLPEGLLQSNTGYDVSLFQQNMSSFDIFLGLFKLILISEFYKKCVKGTRVFTAEQTCMEDMLNSKKSNDQGLNEALMIFQETKLKRALISKQLTSYNAVEQPSIGFSSINHTQQL